MTRGIASCSGSAQRWKSKISTLFVAVRATICGRSTMPGMATRVTDTRVARAVPPPLLPRSGRRRLDAQRVEVRLGRGRAGAAGESGKQHKAQAAPHPGRCAFTPPEWRANSPRFRGAFEEGGVVRPARFIASPPACPAAATRGGVPASRRGRARPAPRACTSRSVVCRSPCSGASSASRICAFSSVARASSSVARISGAMSCADLRRQGVHFLAASPPARWRPCGNPRRPRRTAPSRAVFATFVTAVCSSSKPPGTVGISSGVLAVLIFTRGSLGKKLSEM